MVEAERASKSKGRAAGIVAARDLFYKGEIARHMVAFLQKNGAPFDSADFADFFARIEEAISVFVMRHRQDAVSIKVTGIKTPFNEI